MDPWVCLLKKYHDTKIPWCNFSRYFVPDSPEHLSEAEGRAGTWETTEATSTGGRVPCLQMTVSFPRMGLRSPGLIPTRHPRLHFLDGLLGWTWRVLSGKESQGSLASSSIRHFSALQFPISKMHRSALDELREPCQSRCLILCLLMGNMLREEKFITKEDQAKWAWKDLIALGRNHR